MEVVKTSLVALDRESYFLSYNIDNVLKHLLAIEDHLRNLDENYEAPDASCIVKHLLQLDAP